MKNEQVKILNVTTEKKRKTKLEYLLLQTYSPTQCKQPNVEMFVLNLPSMVLRQYVAILRHLILLVFFVEKICENKIH